MSCKRVVGVDSCVTEAIIRVGLAVSGPETKNSFTRLKKKNVVRFGIQLSGRGSFYIHNGTTRGWFSSEKVIGCVKVAFLLKSCRIYLLKRFIEK